MRGPLRHWRAMLCAYLCLLLALACALVPVPALAEEAQAGSTPVYQTLDELEGKTFAYVNGSVYNQKVAAKVPNTKEDFYASLADCVAAVEAGKADAAVQLSYCCQLVVNQKGGSVTLLPESVDDVEEGFFFPRGSQLTAQFNETIKKFEDDGTIDELTKKWVVGDDTGKTLPAQDWDAPNGTLKFATSGVLEPFSYVGEGGEILGYDVDLALHIAKELGYHLEISAIAMDAIFASVQSGKVDFGGTLTNTPERAQAVDFSEPVMPCTISVIVKAEGGDSGAGASAEPEIATLAGLEGKRVAMITGTIYDQYMSDILGGSYEFSYFASISDLIAALVANKTDAFATDKPVAELACNRSEGIAILPEPLVEDEYGMFFQKGSELTAKFSEVITRLVQDGTLASLQKKWTSADDAAKTLPEQDWDTPNGTLTMVTSGIVEPLSYIKDGEATGYDIELALLCCKELGYGLEVKAMDFSAIIAEVQSGKADFGSCATSITEERKQAVDFSVPIYKSAAVFVVRTTGATDNAAAGLFAGLGESFRKTFVEEDRWQLILSGLGVTVLISVCAGALGLLLGYATVLARRGGVRWVGRLVDAFQALMGGLPLVVVLMVLYYVVFGSINIAGEIVAIAGFTLAFGATSGTTMWTAITGIDTIQEETGLALGYTRKQVFRKIIFPQARQQFMPQLMGQFVSLVKDTAIVGYIAVQDLTRASDLIRARTMDAFFPLISTAIIYFVFCRLLARLLGRVSRRFDVTSRPREVEGVTQ